MPSGTGSADSVPSSKALVCRRIARSRVRIFRKIFTPRSALGDEEPLCRIPLGRADAQRPPLLELTRTVFRRGTGGYVPAPDDQALNRSAALGSDAGLIGALLLAYS